MKLIISGLIILSSLFYQNDSIAFSGKSYVVMDARTNQVLESKNEHHVQSVASISKIMTCIIAIENMDLNTIITVDDTINKAWGSGVYIHIGDKLSLRDLLYGLMLRSGNDAAVMIAKGVSKSVPNFVELMNNKAKELGLEHTTFSNPTGLDEEDDGNRSCAYDMAKLTSYCHQNLIFNEIVGTKTYKREDGNGTWHNKNRLLKEYEYCVGGKTGFTTIARRTLVTIASKDNVDLIVVTLNCGNDFEFHKSEYEKYFDIYKNTRILDKGILEYENQRYLLDFDLSINKLDKDEVDIKVENNQVVVEVNNQMVVTKDVKPFNIVSCIKMIFKGLFYG